MEFLHDYTFILKHKVGVENKVVDELSWRVIILIIMSAKVIGFEKLREGYDSCPDFGEIYVTLRDGSVHEIDSFLLQDDYLFRFCKLCIPRTSLKDFLLGNT